jgi:hypothetical protein
VICGKVFHRLSVSIATGCTRRGEVGQCRRDEANHIICNRIAIYKFTNCNTFTNSFLAYSSKYTGEERREGDEILTFDSFGAMKLLHRIVSVSVTIKLEKAVSKCRPMPRFPYLQTNNKFSDQLYTYFKPASTECCSLYTVHKYLPNSLLV